eukprot:TRINITY_DN313_c0_g1_i3.p1 TRINITY_DN313_c0_g1~~TRINITY_DN313_c0_g1_i3.p1  ORF type:complete len:109 (+),score=21.43 TRINITY_DN313_c0_g1_i3:3-329(+)
MVVVVAVVSMSHGVGVMVVVVAVVSMSHGVGMMVVVVAVVSMSHGVGVMVVVVAVVSMSHTMAKGVSARLNLRHLSVDDAGVEVGAAVRAELGDLGDSTAVGAGRHVD